MRALSQTMKFPDYFGNNWDALEECLNDMEWLPAKGYVIQFKNADLFAKNRHSDFAVFVRIVRSVSASWKARNVDFVLIVESNNRDILSL